MSTTLLDIAVDIYDKFVKSMKKIMYSFHSVSLVFGGEADRGRAELSLAIRSHSVTTGT